MPITTTTRLGLTRWSSDSDSWSREQFDSNMGRLEALAAVFTQGPAAERPEFSPDGGGILYFATDTGGLWYGDGEDWYRLLTVDTTAAADVKVTATGGVAATNVQAAIVELDTEKAPRDVTATAAPTTGAHVVGERVWNSAPAAGGTIGWVCVTAGTPGTWKPWGTIGS